MVRTDKQINEMVNGYLNKFKRNAVCLNPRAGKNGTANLVQIKCLLTNRVSDPIAECSLKRGNWPFERSDAEITETINGYLNKFKRDAICVNPRAGKTKVGINLVQIRCLKTNRISNPIAEGSLKLGSWPFRNRSDEEIIDQVHEHLKKYKRNAICVNPRAGKNGLTNLVQIKCLLTNRISDPIAEGNLKRGSWPWNEDQDRVELRVVHPMYIKLFKKYNIKHEYNFELGSKIIDFAFEHPITKKLYGLEVKRSDKWHSKKGQIPGYKKLASLKQYGLAGVIVSDPKGSHKKKGSVSIKELEEQFILTK